MSETTDQNNQAINLFTEQTDVTPTTPVPIDITPSADPFPFTYTVSNLTPGSIPAGTAVDSYFMFSNPVGRAKLLYPYHAL